MLTNIDSELFPDDCEAVEIPSHNLWVYLIQKNGSTSLRRKCSQHQWRMLKNQDLKTLPYIDVFVRDPEQRYVSGVNTVLQFLARDYPDLDEDTSLWFLTRYNFLNRHFLPQWHWLLNLSRFISQDCRIRFHDFNEFGSLVDVHSRAGITPASDNLKKKILESNSNLLLWFYTDQILLDLSGKSMTWKEVVEHYRTQHNECFKLATEKFYQLADVLPKT